MKIDVRTPQSVYITIGNKTFYIDDSTNESIMELLKDERYCNNCGSNLAQIVEMQSQITMKNFVAKVAIKQNQ